MLRLFAIGILSLGFLTSCQSKDTQEPSAEIPKLIRGPIPDQLVAEFSGENAFQHVVELTKFGPRPPESEGYEKSLRYIEGFLAPLGWKTHRNTFQAQTPLGRMTFTNLIARYAEKGTPNWSQSPPIILGGHLDTKLYPDITFVGANDSGSSTGVLLEMARLLSKHPAGALNVELVFFDGEEAILEDMIFRKDGLYGSTNYAKRLRKRTTMPSLGFVIDLVGDPKVDLIIGADSAPKAIAHSKKAVQTLGLEDVIQFPGVSFLDDHVALMVFANLPVLHLIGDFREMSYWHTKDDTLDQISPAQLQRAGQFTVQVLSQMTK